MEEQPAQPNSTTLDITEIVFGQPPSAENVGEAHEVHEIEDDDDDDLEIIEPLTKIQSSTSGTIGKGGTMEPLNSAKLVVECVTERNRSISQTETCENLISTLSQWDWVTIDGLKLPAVTRSQERYVAVHMVQLKLLSKFPPDIPLAIRRQYAMRSHKMTLTEAWTFNSINAIIRKFDLGCQLFNANDELVKLNDVQMFYWNVKLFNLQRVNEQYDKCMAAAANNIPLLATATQLKRQVENDIIAVRTELDRLGPNYELGHEQVTNDALFDAPTPTVLTQPNN